MIRWRAFIWILLFSISSFAAKGQNLVLNPGFEAFKKCPDDFTEKKLKLKNHVMAISGTPDYFNACSSNFGTDKNPFGYQRPFEGNGYCGLNVTSHFENECFTREYIQLQLSEPLKGGYKYAVSMRVSLAENSGYYTDQIGLCFSDFDYSKKGVISNLYGHYDVRNEVDHFINETSKWTEIKGTYNAEGGESYILIGNFQHCNRTSRKALHADDKVSKSMKRSYMMDDEVAAMQGLAYYFVDYISVTPLGKNDSISYLLPEDACSDQGIDFKKVENLIEDPGFNLNKESANPVWSSASSGTPDFLKDGKMAGSVNKFAGLYLHSSINVDNREYITSKLKMRLTPCHTYHFSFKVKKSAASKYAVDRIGMAVVDSLYKKKGRMIFPLKPDVESPEFRIINNIDNWITVCGEFTPVSCASYIIIGNFISDEETYIVLSDNNTGDAPWAYYFVDDIELYQVDDLADCTFLCEGDSAEEIVLENTEVVEDTSSSTEISIYSTDTLSLNFDIGSYSISEIDESWVSQIKKQLKENDSLILNIDGHTDNTGSDKINDSLSGSRAKKAYELLKKMGVDQNKMKYDYFGSKAPKLNNSTEANRRVNRRVDLYLTEKGSTN